MEANEDSHLSMSQPHRHALTFRVSDILQREGNALGVVRLLCAALVIYGHSFSIVNDPFFLMESWDPATLFRYEGLYCASLAVKVFFFISGLLITNSLLTHVSVTHYLFGRFLRIWPALIAMTLVTAVVIGPWMSSLTTTEYFSSAATIKFTLSQLLLQPTNALPGVFDATPLPTQVNGALWSLAYEVAAYGAILFLHVLGVLRHRWFATLIGIMVIADPLLPQPVLFPWLHINPQFVHLPSCFTFGALLALHKDRLRLSPLLIAGSIAAFLVFRRAPDAGATLLYFSIFLLLLYFSAAMARLSWRPRADLSYGTFLWGFPIQQSLVAVFPDRGLPWHLAVALGLTLLVAAASWYGVERPALAWSQDLARRWPLDFGSLRRRIGIALALVLLFIGWQRIKPVLARTDGPTTSNRLIYESNAISIHPPFQREWPLKNSTNHITFRVAFDPTVCVPGKTNGADLILEVIGTYGPSEVFRRRLDPVGNPGDREIVTSTIILPPFAHGSRLVLRTEPGPDGNTAWDWLFLLGLRFESGGQWRRQQFPGFSRIPEVAEISFSALLPDDGGVMLHAPADLRFPLAGNERDVRIQYGLLPSAYEAGGHSDGVVFRLELLRADSTAQEIGAFPLNPAIQPSHRGTQQIRVQLPPCRSGDTLRLHIEPGEHGNSSWDQAYVKTLEIN